LIGNKGFVYKKGDKKWIKKISDFLEEGKTVMTERVSAGMKPAAACLVWLTLLGTNEWLPVWKDWARKVINIVVQKIERLSEYYNNITRNMDYSLQEEFVFVSYCFI